MYICCGDIAWGRDEQIAGAYKGYLLNDDLLSKVVNNKKLLDELIAHRLKILTELQSLLTSWEGRSENWSSECIIRLKHAQAILPVVRAYHQSTLASKADDTQVELQALRYRTIQHRLCSIKFCDSYTEADQKEFLQEVDCVFSKLQPNMTEAEQNAVLLSADERVPGLFACFDKSYQELAAITKTFFRATINEVEKWSDAPGHCQEQSAPDTQLLDPRCTAVLAVAIILGYNGECYCFQCMLQALHNKIDVKPIIQQCSVVDTPQVKDKPVSGHQQGCKHQMIDLVKKAGIVIDPNMNSMQPVKAFRIIDQAVRTNKKPGRSSKSANHIAMHQRKMAMEARQVSCIDCEPISLFDWLQHNLANSL